jgi:hypothetical protein
MKFILAAALALAAQPVLAQAERPALAAVLAEITGREVAVAGHVNRGTDGYTLATDAGFFRVDFAVDREALERLRGCPDYFARPQACAITAIGVIRFVAGMPNLTLSDVVFTD